MKIIWKFRLQGSPYPQSVSMPVGAQVLSCGIDGNGDLCVWALVESNNPPKPKEFLIVATGERFENTENWRLVGTAFDLPYVWHVFVLDIEERG